MRRSKEYSGNTSSCHAGLSGAVDGGLLLGSWFLGKVRPKHELQILFGQKVVDETWHGMCVCSCVQNVWEKTTWPMGFSAWCVLLHWELHVGW